MQSPQYNAELITCLWLTTFQHHLWSITKQTHGQMGSICYCSLKYFFICLLCDKHACTKSENFLSNLVKGSRIYCHLTCITPVSPACGSKTLHHMQTREFQTSITINLKIDQKGYLAKTCGISARSPDTLPL